MAILTGSDTSEPITASFVCGTVVQQFVPPSAVADTVFDGSANDTVKTADNLAVTADGGDDIDTVDASAMLADFSINLATGLTNFADTYVNFENVTTGSGSDTLTGNSPANELIAGAGFEFELLIEDGGVLAAAFAAADFTL